MSWVKDEYCDWGNSLRLLYLVLLVVLTGCSILNTMIDEQDASTTTADADVEYVRAVYDGDNAWTFHVTVRHPDSGWEDYADGWDVVMPDGTVILPDSSSPFTRLLLHPHETEQPFTRSQRGIIIPADVSTVTVRAHDIVDGFGGQEVIVDLSTMSGTNYEIQR